MDVFEELIRDHRLSQSWRILRVPYLRHSISITPLLNSVYCAAFLAPQADFDEIVL